MMTTQIKKWDFTLLYLLLILLPPIVYFVVLVVYSPNVPKADDYNDSLYFLSHFIDAGTWQDKLYYFFGQNNEHRTTTSRLIYVLMYYLHGTLNYKWLMYIGNTSIAGVAVLLACQFTSHTEKLFICCFTSVYLFHLQAWSSMFWAMTALSNYVVIFFSLISLTLLYVPRISSVLWASFFAVAASYSQGNGLLIWPVGGLFIVYLYYCDRNFPIRQVLPIWCVIGVSCIAAYFYHYQVSVPPVPIPSRLEVLSLEPWRPLWWFLGFLGSGFLFESANLHLSIVFGALLLILACGAIYTFRKTYPVLVFFTILILCSALLATFNRFHVFDIGLCLSSHYKIYSNYLIFIVVMAIFVHLYERHRTRIWINMLIITLALTHTILGYTTSLPKNSQMQTDAISRMRTWLLSSNVDDLGFFTLWIQDANNKLVQGIAHNVWQPEYLFDNVLKVRDTTTIACLPSFNALNPVILKMRRQPSAVVGNVFLASVNKDLLENNILHIVYCEKNKFRQADIKFNFLDGEYTAFYSRFSDIETANDILVQDVTGKISAIQLIPQMMANE